MRTDIDVQPQSASSSVVTDAFIPHERVQNVPKGHVLYREGGEPAGVYFLRAGEVDLVFAAKSGEAKALRVAEPGQILGLSCIVSRCPNDCTATTRTPCTIGFVDRETLETLLDEQPALWLQVLHYISEEVNACWDCMRAISGAR
ncbi:MAG TPA: cyclic nucleotide-binding domain-containing protein [Thermoanaerobaculia bacterium]